MLSLGSASLCFAVLLLPVAVSALWLLLDSHPIPALASPVLCIPWTVGRRYRPSHSAQRGDYISAGMITQ